ncbi:MAG: DUF2279 domain-containing protein [Bacteroidota bacterium]
MQYEFKEGSNFFQNATSLNKKRQRISSRILAGAYVGIFSYMGLVWYAGEDLSGFHFFDDSHEWKQMDKVGHVMGGFQCSRYVTSMLKWSGVPKKRAIIQGSLSGLAVMSTIEIFDAFGESWGFSWSDMGANVLGSGLSVANQAIWNEDRLQLKMSYIKSPYAGDPEFERLFGSTYPEWFLKDYNGQAYWLSVRVHSFLPESSFKDKYPPWLNLAVGYGAEGLEGGYDIDESWRAREYRQLYLSIDLDLDNIKTRSALLKRVLSALNLIRIPLPALQFDKNGVKFLPLR